MPSLSRQQKYVEVNCTRFQSHFYFIGEVKQLF